MCGNCDNTPIQAQASADQDAVGEKASVKPRIRLGEVNMEASVLTALHILVKEALKKGIKLEILDASRETNMAIMELKATRPEIFQVKSGVVLAAKIAQKALENIVNKTQPQAAENTIYFEGNDVVSIKPFGTLDDALITAEKVARLVYPDSLGEVAQIQKYEADLLRAVATIPTLALEQKFEGLTAVLAIVLMGFESEDLGAVKAFLKSSLEDVTKAEVKKNTSTFLIRNGFAQV